ncbi:divalent heavy-metal cation transporter [Heliomicrobium modesticaldum Ice1]|uniref:Divalent heavy-metal cation transporter n=1 Tax=Heliobacterium modesticaldum (strain ATCC 51547 / Ice1) TaxID=498761 RepID=B0TD74_HELMI|nr:ZIP family metal transporter [Heliomicrobium modesticaldum]ABZ84115.1 divalent heavy-metal cation transporter [Heliomicrobium modesticaldum Ice1]
MSEVLLPALAAAMMTVLGAVPFFFITVTHRLRDILLGLAAGMMVTAAFALLQQTPDFWLVAPGMVIGAGLLFVLLRFLPEGGRLAWLTFAAIALHNVPEGLVVGVGYADGDKLGLLMALTIGLQNVPEGLVIVAPLLEQGVNRWKALSFVFAAAMVEPLFALSGYVLVEQVQGLLPVALGFAAGAMLYVTFRELIPDTHGHGFEEQATFAFLTGVIVMMGLATALG